jgi:hypothetical protein
MTQALLEALRTGRYVADLRTTSALRSRDLLRMDGSLTDQGFNRAVALAPLAEQCEVLGFPLRRIPVRTSGPPELAALEVARRSGWRGTACEGRAALTLLKAGIFDFLRENSPLGPDDATSQMVEAQILSYQQQHAGEFGSVYAPRNALYGPIDYARWEEALAHLLRNELVREQCRPPGDGAGLRYRPGALVSDR